MANQLVRINGPISRTVSSAFARAFSRQAAIFKIVEEKALRTRFDFGAKKLFKANASNIHQPPKFCLSYLGILSSIKVLTNWWNTGKA